MVAGEPIQVLMVGLSNEAFADSMQLLQPLKPGSKNPPLKFQETLERWGKIVSIALIRCGVMP